MTHQKLDQIVADLVIQLSTQGFENPLSFAMIKHTGRTSSGSSSPTQEEWIEPIPGQADVVPDRLPIHVLFVDARSRAAHGVIRTVGRRIGASVHLRRTPLAGTSAVVVTCGARRCSLGGACGAPPLGEGPVETERAPRSPHIGEGHARLAIAAMLLS